MIIKEIYIHTDASDLTMIVFLGKTNLDSGLNLYDNHNQEIVSYSTIFVVRTEPDIFIVEDSTSHI